MLSPRGFLLALLVSGVPTSAVAVDSSLAGAVPDGSATPGTPLMIKHAPNGMIELSWGHSCDDDDVDYAIYAGFLGNYTSHVPVDCTTAGATSYTVPAAGPGAYYLIVALSDSAEGSYGVDSLGNERPASSQACADQLRKSCAQARCEASRGIWTDCGPIAPHCLCPGALCGPACVPQCLCGGIAGFGCPQGMTCNTPTCGADIFGICQ